jgi:hypothetical protein
VDVDRRLVVAAAGDWALALLFFALLLSWWVLLAWWIGRYGARDVTARFISPTRSDAVRDWVDYYGIWLAGAGYRIVDQRPDRVALIGHYRPRWEIAVAVLLFPLGLLALLGTKPAHLVVTATDDGVSVEGKLHRQMARELENDAAKDSSWNSGAEASTPPVQG